MFAKIIGSLFMLLGFLFLVSPERMRTKLRRKGVRKIRRYLFALSVLVGGFLISTAWQYSGILPKVLAALGLIAIFKGFYFLKSKSADVATEWLLVQPALYFRLLALAQIAVGLLIVLGLKK